MTIMSALHAIVRLPARGVLLLLRFYQRFISPMTPPTCRFYPSCSQYAVVAVTRHGVVRGTWLAGRRLLRCHPGTPEASTTFLRHDRPSHTCTVIVTSHRPRTDPAT
ncbi:membrane protein insertion efficiency factor YidD [Cellulomonas soli]